MEEQPNGDKRSHLIEIDCYNLPLKLIIGKFDSKCVMSRRIQGDYQQLKQTFVYLGLLFDVEPLLFGIGSAFFGFGFN